MRIIYCGIKLYLWAMNYAGRQRRRYLPVRIEDNIERA
jgi:hypothetical protein